MILVELVLDDVQHCLDRAYATAILGPRKDRAGDVSWRPPVDKYGITFHLLRGCRVGGELLADHPLSDLLDGIQLQTSVDAAVLADWGLIKIIEADGVFVVTFCPLEYEPLPHGHLPLSSVKVLLQCEEVRPAVIGWHLESGIHFD